MGDVYEMGWYEFGIKPNLNQSYLIINFLHVLNWIWVK